MTVRDVRPTSAAKRHDRSRRATSRRSLATGGAAHAESFRPTSSTDTGQRVAASVHNPFTPAGSIGRQ